MPLLCSDRWSWLLNHYDTTCFMDFSVLRRVDVCWVKLGCREGHSPFCCRASCLLVSISCSVAARFLGRLPVLLGTSRGLCWVRGRGHQYQNVMSNPGLQIVFKYSCRLQKWARHSQRRFEIEVYPGAAVASQRRRSVLQGGCGAGLGLMERKAWITVQLGAEHLSEKPHRM